jgi:arginase
MVVRLIGVPFDGMGRDPGQAGAPAALRAAGLEAALSGRDVVSRPDLVVARPRAERDRETGLLNGAALLPMLGALREELTAALAAGQFPLVYGADCSVLLAAIPALRPTLGEPGLLFIDAHEDTTPFDRSPDGEAANMEVAMLVGMPSAGWPASMSGSIGVLKPDALAMLGQHDDEWRRPIGVESFANRVMLLNAEQVATDPARAARDGVGRISATTPNWWSHIDLDVLDERDFFARGAPGEIVLSGGLTWQQLTEVVQAALRAGGCRGLSVVIYNPDLDPDRRLARRIVQFVSDIAPSLP